MKKSVFLFLIIFSSLSSFAQTSAADEFHPHFYCSVDGGFGFPAMKRSLAETTMMSSDSSTYVESAAYYSFGKGFTEGAFGGYAFHPNVSAEIGFSYLDAERLTEFINTSAVHGYYTYTPRSARLYLGVKIGYEKPRYSAYLRIAFLAGRQSMSVDGNIVYAAGGSYGVTNYTPGNSFGIRSSGGVSFHVHGPFSVFAEATFYGLNWAPASSVKESAPAGSSVSNTNTIYVEQIPNGFCNCTPYNPNASNEPGQWFKFYWPFSSFGFSTGIKMDIQYHHKKKH